MTDLSADGLTLLEPKPHAWRRRDYLRVYVGENWQEYVGVFNEMEKKPGLAPSWSWTILLIPSIWMVYRRRYGWAIGMIIVGEFLNRLPEGKIFSIVTLGIYVLLGSLGKALYVRSALADIDRVLARTQDQHARVELVRAKGGVSDRGVLVLVSAFLLLYLALFAFAAIHRL